MTFQQQLRKQIRKQRKQLSQEQQEYAAKCVAQKALAHSKVKNAKNVALFLSFDGEIDTLPLIRQLWEQQKNVYLPVLHPFSEGNLLFLHYTQNSTMTENRFHISEPVLDVRYVRPQNELDVIFTPLVAFDSQGHRMGMGGGYYDRTLADWKKQKKMYPIGLAHDCQQVKRLPSQPWDIPLPEIITPSRLWQW